ncbi:hypothetical protein [Leptolyngbya ohadii]|uniref:hypothetical protein n=1 Tax=Leptolyngbya ohadii TaxID=1962290 RepID=UPI0019D46E80|nr:hypothetical protein [Leptolyngbya ohadii]
MQQIEQELETLQQSHPVYRCTLEILQTEPAYLTDPHHEFVQILRRNASQYRADSYTGSIEKEVPLVSNGAGSVGNVISRLFDNQSIQEFNLAIEE